MIDDDGLILIDHELSFHFLDGDSKEAYEVLMTSFNNNYWSSTYLKHIFYTKLKAYKGSKKHLFDTFEEYLSKLDVTKVEFFLVELGHYQISVGQSELLIH